MSKDILQVLLNPIRMRIMQLFAPGTREQMTVGEISDLLSDIPRTTLYRHINVLIEAGVLDVVSERKVRGSVERTLSLNTAELEKLRGNNVENVPQVALRFLMAVYAKFEKYFRTHDRIEDGDTMFLTSSILMLSDQEFEEFLAEITAVFNKYRFEDVTAGRRPRDISVICAPPDDMSGKES